MGRLKYLELAKARIKPQRNVVISKTIDGENNFLGYSITEQLVTNEGERETKVFLRNGLGILNREGLEQLRNAIDETLEKITK